MSPDCGLTEGKEGNEVNFAKLWECVRVFAPLLGNASRLKAMRGRIALLERFAHRSNANAAQSEGLEHARLSAYVAQSSSRYCGTDMLVARLASGRKPL